MVAVGHAVKERVATIAHRLVAAMMNLELHASTDQFVQDSVAGLARELAAAFAAGATDPLVLRIKDKCFYYDDELLLCPSLQAGRFVSACHARDIHGLEIGARTDAAEILTFLLLLDDETRREEFRGHGVAAMLRAAGVEHIAVTRAHVASEPDGLDLPSSDTLSQYQALTDCIQENHVAAARGHDLEIEKACGIVESALSKVNAPAGLLALASHHFIDSFTVGHSVRVSLLALQVAAAGGASREDLIRVGTAGLLHDIGKSRIPQEILFKQGRLTDEERAEMSRHPRLGGEVLLEQPGLDPATIGAAFCHHMGPGGGYPDPALKFEPSPVSKLVRVCDVFEALTAVRPYKKALSPLEAYAVMFRNEGDFDQDWLRFFVQAMGIYPQGTFLSLNTGEVGLVTGRGAGATQPEVQLMTAADGTPLPEGDQQTVVLGMDVDGIVRDVEDETLGEPGEAHDHEEDDAGVQGCCGDELV